MTDVSTAKFLRDPFEVVDGPKTLDLELTEIETQTDFPVLYIYCDLSRFHSARKLEYMERVKRDVQSKLPNHIILVGDVDLKFAYITPQEALYHELKQDHRSKE